MRAQRIITVLILVFISAMLSAQGFPEAEKQPRMKEQRANQRKNAKRAKRRHVKRGTVYVAPWGGSTQIAPICLLADKRSLPNMG